MATELTVSFGLGRILPWPEIIIKRLSLRKFLLLTFFLHHIVALVIYLTLDTLYCFFLIFPHLLQNLIFFNEGV